MGRDKEGKNFHWKDAYGLNTTYSVSRQTTVVNALGMHARPAARIAEIAIRAQGNIWLSAGDLMVDASSIIDILTLCAVTGTKIVIHAEDPSDERIVDEIKGLFDMGFGENLK